jgi:hypothetical protein
VFRLLAPRRMIGGVGRSELSSSDGSSFVLTTPGGLAQSYKSETPSVLSVTTVHVFFTQAVVSALPSPPGAPCPPSNT